MTALQFARRRQKLFRTMAEAAEAMGVTVATISYWEHGRRPVPRYAEIILKCLEEKAKENAKCTCWEDSDSIENTTCPIHGIV